MFDACMAALKFQGDPNKMAQSLVHKVTNACDMTMNKRRHVKHKEAVNWWTDEIAKLRKECIGCRRKFTRSEGKPENSFDSDKLKQRSSRESVIAS